MKIWNMTYISKRGKVYTYPVSLMGLPLTEEIAQVRVNRLNAHNRGLYNLVKDCYFIGNLI